MKASIVDLRYKMSDILRALARNEKVTILYHGKIKGIISPPPLNAGAKVRDHPIFGSLRNDARPVDEIMNGLRGNRFDAL